MIQKRVYIATAMSNKEGQRALAAKLLVHGIGQTLDWTVLTAPDDLKFMIPFKEIQGVRQANALIVLLVKDQPQRGTHVEIGAALALGVPVCLVGTPEQQAQTSFYSHRGIWMKVDPFELGWEDYVIGFCRGCP